jgi:hypothetical protein
LILLGYKGDGIAGIGISHFLTTNPVIVKINGIMWVIKADVYRKNKL